MSRRNPRQAAQQAKLKIAEIIREMKEEPYEEPVENISPQPAQIRLVEDAGRRQQKPPPQIGNAKRQAGPHEGQPPKQIRAGQPSRRIGPNEENRSDAIENQPSTSRNDADDPPDDSIYLLHKSICNKKQVRKVNLNFICVGQTIIPKPIDQTRGPHWPSITFSLLPSFDAYEATFFVIGHKNWFFVYKCLLGTEISLEHEITSPENVEYFCSGWSPVFEQNCWLAVGGSHDTDHGIISVYNLKTMEVQAEFKVNAGPFNDLKFHPKNPHFLLAGTSLDTAILYNVQHQHMVGVFRVSGYPTADVLHVDFCPSGRCFLTVNVGSEIKLWSLEKGAVVDTIWHSTRGLDVHPAHEYKPRRVLRCDPTIFIKNIRWVDYHYAVANGNTIIVLDYWHDREGKTRGRHMEIIVDQKRGQYFRKFDVCSCNNTMAAGTNKGEIVIWKYNRSNLTKIRKNVLINDPKAKRGVPIRNLGFSQDGKTLIVVNDKGVISRWEMPRKCPIY